MPERQQQQKKTCCHRCPNIDGFSVGSKGCAYGSAVQRRTDLDVDDLAQNPGPRGQGLAVNLMVFRAFRNSGADVGSVAAWDVVGDVRRLRM